MPDNVQEVLPIDWSRLPEPLELEPPGSFDVPVVNLGIDLLTLPAVSHELWTERMQLLVGFAIEHGLKVHEIRRLGRTVGVSLNGRGRAGIYQFALLDEREMPSLVCATHPLKLDQGTFCISCFDEHPFGTVVCTRHNRAILCEWCLVVSPQLFEDNDRAFCGHCAGRCDVAVIEPLPAPPETTTSTWAALVPRWEPCNAPVQPGMPICEAHAGGERANCVNCGDFAVAGVSGAYSDYYGGIACDGCSEPRAYCENCDAYVLVADIEDGWCSSCNEPEPVALPNAHTEEFDESEKDEADLMIPTIPGRENLRLCGLEIEGAGRARQLINALFEAELIQYPEMSEYHTQTRNGSRATYWSLERDSSVDWELVSPPINLADATDIRGLRSALRVVRAEIKAGNVSLDLRCGLHVHVGAERVGITHAYHLGQVWGYLEDVIFRLGAAKWPFHRAIQNGLHYCNPTPKGAKTKLEFGRQLDDEGSSRYNALSFANYIQGFTRNCVCGAVRYDSWDQCTCELGKCTFEFRVFNTSANMHKIHAYLALCQALVAWATNNDTIDPAEFPAQTFQPVLVEGMREAVRTDHVAKWLDRLSFMFNELPLTEGEKYDLLYCVQHSELGQHLSDQFVNSLIQEVAIA